VLSGARYHALHAVEAQHSFPVWRLALLHSIVSVKTQTAQSHAAKLVHHVDALSVGVS